LNWLSAVILGAFGLWSIAIVGGWTRSFDGWFLNDWNSFLVGALLWWVIDRKISSWWLIAFAGLMTIASVRTQAWGTWTGLLTMSAIAMAAWSGRLETALGNRPMQFLARISYSLYLLHALIGPQIDGWVSWHFRDSLTAAVLGVALSIAISIAAAWVMHRYVEQPGIRWGKRFKHNIKPPMASAALYLEFDPRRCAGGGERTEQADGCAV
jgi:peptidoglycan/LPS O-acetylase OafA/YrhL